MSNLPPGQPDRGSSGQTVTRTIFQVLGVLVLGALVLITIAGMDFFAAGTSDDFGAQPTKFWLFFVGLPLLFLGSVFLQLGIVGNAPRAAGTGPYCRSCGRQNGAYARFCDSCATSMSA